jgi:starvation-inducible DNA-binding protein
MSDTVKKLAIILADTYALYLKTQNYHWHVKGPQFKPLHELFEMQYLELAEAVDEVAERMLIKGHNAPATFSEFERLKTLADGNSDSTANEMVTELAHDHGELVKDLYVAMSMAQDDKDEATVNVLSDRIEAHEKYRWMLSSSQENA